MFGGGGGLEEVKGLWCVTVLCLAPNANKYGRQELPTYIYGSLFEVQFLLHVGGVGVG